MPLSILVFALASLLLLVGQARAQEAIAPPGNDLRAACLASVLETRDAENAEARRVAMANEIERYQALVEEALSLRAKAIRFHQGLQAKQAEKQALSGQDLQTLQEGTQLLLSQRQELMSFAERYECWTAAPPSSVPEQAAVQIAGVAMSLSAALILYDNYLSAIAPFRNDPALRQLINKGDRGFGLHAGKLNEIAQSFGSVDNRQRVKRAIEWLVKYQPLAEQHPVAGYRYLQALIEQSPSLAIVRKLKPFKDIFNGIGQLGDITIDALFSLKSEGTSLSSLVFGNAIGLVETRRGKLYKQAAVAERVSSALKAGDILLEKTPFRLTDTFIPGHWGHAAIWIGTESELRALNIWDHPVVVPHQKAVRQGHGVVEALRSGVELNTLSHFLNIDDLGVLRHTTLPDEKRAEVILLALRQIGKPYDFNFDAETSNRVFCSKLVYLAYGDLQWPTSRIMGRVTVSPDNIAARAFSGGQLSLALLYHDGQEVTEQPLEFMRRLIKPVELSAR